MSAKKRKGIKSIDWKVYGIFLFIPVFLIMIFSIFNIVSDMILDSEKENLIAKSENSALQIDNWTKKVSDEFHIYKNLIEMNCETNDDIKTYLTKTFIHENDYPSGLFIGDEYGKFYDTTGWEPGRDYEITERPWYKKAMKEEGIVFTEPYMDKMKECLCITLSSKVDFKSDKITYSKPVLGADIYIDYPNRIVNSLVKDDTINGAVLVTNNKHTIISASDGEFYSGRSLFDYSISLDAMNFEKAASKDELINGKVIGQTEYLIKVTEINNGQWFLISYVKRFDILNNIYKMLGVCLLIGLIALIIIFMLTRSTLGLVSNVREESSMRQKINEAMARSYNVMLYMNIKDDVFEEVLVTDELRAAIGGSEGVATDCMKRVIKATCLDLDVPKLKEFVRFSTLDKRLKGKTNISIEYLSRHKHWCRARFVPVEYDSDGNLLSVLYLARYIDGDVISLRDRLEVEETLLECVKTLAVNNKNFDESIERLLHIICQYHDAERAYIFDIDMKNGVGNNTFEYSNSEGAKMVRNLKNMDLSVISRWFEEFAKHGSVVIDNVSRDLDKSSMEYMLLRSYEVDTLYAVPIVSDDGELIGIMGVDNPKENVGSQVLLKSVALFVREEQVKKKYTDELYVLSYTDQLTNVGNRHAYNEEIQALNEKNASDVGVIFVDINGMKTTNDTYGHVAGDEKIISVANNIKETFRQSKIFRIGGDEFVVISEGIEEVKFMGRVASFVEKMGDVPVASVGEVWVASVNDLLSQVKDADTRMYRRKKEYYSKIDKDRRKR